MQVPRTDVTVLGQRLPLRLAKRSPRRRELGRCCNSSFSTATPAPAWTPPSAGERQSVRLLRIGLKASEQADWALLRHTTISIAQPFEAPKDLTASVREQQPATAASSATSWLLRTICSSVVVGDDAAALVLAAGAILANGDP